MATAYTILGVAPLASHDEIRAAFRAKCEECHPDRATSDVDRAARTGKMAKLTLAWRYLGDAESRAKYDRKLADLERSPEPQPDNGETIDGLLQRLRSTSRAEAGAMAEEFGRAAGLDGPALDRARQAAQKGADITNNVADLIGLVRGFQR